WKSSNRPGQPSDALHCKFSATNLGPVAGDNSYGHLQLTQSPCSYWHWAQMTASGLSSSTQPKRWHFVQNLVFYIDSAYTVCDYGIWERGDKTNHGMAKAALEAMSELDLFGSCGSNQSSVHVLADDFAETALPYWRICCPGRAAPRRLTLDCCPSFGFPAFALDNEEVIGNTRNCIVGMLEGRYALLPLLRDGLPHSGRDSSRLYYDAWELKQFENIECEWPLCSFATCYSRRCSLRMKLKLIRVASERSHRQPGPPGSGAAAPPVDSVSLCTVLLLRDGFLRPKSWIHRQAWLALGEPKPDLWCRLQDFKRSPLGHQNPSFSAKVLGHFYRHLGRCPTLGLSGRSNQRCRHPGTSRLYNVGSRTVVFTPHLDVNFLLDLFRTDVAYLKSTWSAVGRPLFVI
uniref:Phosphorylase b kinase regulatory subunit n=1 Tax=Macrostomum lignano TaxID=282301 RepID=A0A1I8FLH4_9PLAT